MHCLTVSEKSFIITINYSCDSFSVGVLFWIVLNTELIYAPGCLCTLLNVLHMVTEIPSVTHETAEE